MPDEKVLESPEFDAAIDAAAAEKKEILTSCKTRAKTNYEKFYEASLVCRRDIEEILDKRKKDRTDDENDKVKVFKKSTAASFRSVVALLLSEEEELAEGEMSAFDKIADKIAKVLPLLRYVGCTALDDAFERRGIRLSCDKLEDKYDGYANQNVMKTVKESVKAGVRLKSEVQDRTDAIKVDRYEQIPAELHYSKETNPTGLKTSDFTKLVDIKAKLLMAATEDAKDKVDEKANTLAGDKEFDIARARMMQKKLICMVPKETEDDAS